MFIDDAALEHRCRSLVANLDLAGASSIEDLAGAVSRHLGVPIRLIPLPHDLASTVSGCLVVGRRDAVVGYPDQADPWYQRITVGHELGHLLCGHSASLPSCDADTGSASECESSADGDSAAGEARGAATTVAALLPDLLDAHQAWSLYRCSATTSIEREAELVGSLLVAALEFHTDPRSPHADRLADLVGRRRSTLR